MSTHDEIQELIPAYALGALDADETTRIQAHVVSCDRCARVLEEYRSVADSLALAVPLIEPPADLKTRTLRGAVEQNAPAVQSLPRKLRAQPLSWWQRLGLAPALAGAALVVALLAFGWNTWQTMQLNQQLAAQRDLMTVIAYTQGNALTIRGTALASQAVGRLYVDPDASVAALVTVNLPPLSPDKVYQVWLTDANGQKMSGGTFTVDQTGNGWLLVRAPQHLDAYTQVVVTTEPRGGSLAPTTPPLLSATLSTQ